MVISTRRAALGVLLAAPLAGSAATASPSEGVQLAHPSDLEAQFLAIGPQLVRLLDQYDRLKLMWEEPHQAWWRAQASLPRAHWLDREELPEWGAYEASRVPADTVDNEIQQLMEPFEDLKPVTLTALLLKLRYAMSFEAETEALEALREHWEREPLCA